MHSSAKSSAGSAVRTLLVAAVLCISAGCAVAEEKTADEHIAAAEDALAGNELRRAASEYLEAARLSDDETIARQATELGFTFGFNDLARAAAERWMEIAPDSHAALVYLALAELREGKVRASRKNFEKILADGDSAVDEQLVDLIGFLYDEDPDDAYRLMEQLAKPYPDSAKANYAVGVLALNANETGEAEARAQRAVELEPDWLKPHLLYARALMSQGEIDEAIDYTARLVGDDPDPDPEARLELAIMYVSAGRDDDALSQVNQVLLEQPSRTDALRLLAIINFRLENYDAAWQDFEDLLTSGSYTMDAFFYLARIADEREDYEQAAALYSRVEDGDNAITAQRRVSGILAQDGRYEEAHEHLASFGRNKPRFAVDMIQAEAQLYAAEENFEAALSYYDQVIEYRPDDEAALLGKAELLLRIDRLDESIAAYREAVRKWPDSAIALNALGYTLADRTGKHREAHRLIKKALKLDPESPAIIDSYGWVLYRLGKPEAALTELERAYAMFKDPEVAAHIVEVLWKLDRLDQAMEVLVDAEERWPDSELLRGIRQRVAPGG